MNNTDTTTGAPTAPNSNPHPNPGLSVADRLDLIQTAWETLTPESKFANMSLAEFKAARADLDRQAATLASYRASLKAAIGERNNADRTTRRLITRVVGSVVADAAYGPDSALYRGMGFVRPADRKSPTTSASPESAGGSAPAAKAGKLRLKSRLDEVLSGWNEFAPEAKFAGMILMEFQSQIGPPPWRPARRSRRHGPRSKARWAEKTMAISQPRS